MREGGAVPEGPIYHQGEATKQREIERRKERNGRLAGIHTKTTNKKNSKLQYGDLQAPETVITSMPFETIRGGMTHDGRQQRQDEWLS